MTKGFNNPRDAGRRAAGKSMSAKRADPATLLWLNNIPFSVTWPELWEAVRALDIGAVRVSLNCDKGTATVFFRTVEDAQRAIGTLDGATLLGRRLYAAMYRSELHPGTKAW